MSTPGEIYDMIGIGFGPANLALAVACEEASADKPLRHLFLETKPSFVWHPGMLIEDSLLQITVLKDLILVENPCSRFTFLSYLKEKGRLYEFLNLRDLYPTRIEFNDYLHWTADQLSDRVHYGREVVAIDPVDEEGRSDAERPSLLRITARDSSEPGGATSEYFCRNLVLAAGGRPQMPPGIQLKKGGRAFHPHVFKQRIAEFDDPNAPYRFVVIGGGQSAGEIFEYLIDHYKQADVTATVRGFGYKPVDDSDFTNRIFFPEWVDYYHELPREKREYLFNDLKNVNYAAIDNPLIHRIYTKLYRQKAAGNERARLRPFMELKAMNEKENSVELEFFETMEEKKIVLDVDGAVICTGWSWPKEHPLLAGVDFLLARDDRGGYDIDRDYKVTCRNGGPGVYLQGYCEETHGISETVLSLLPVRAARIRDSVYAACLSGEPALT